MSTVVRLLTVSLPILIIGLVMLIFGIKIMKFKPIVVSYKTVRTIITLLFAPILIWGFWVVIRNLMFDLGSQSSIILLVCLLFVLIGYILVIFSLSKNFLICNITNNILTESFGEVFDKNGIQYFCNEKTNQLTKLSKVSQISFDFPELELIVKIKISILGFAWVKVKGDFSHLEFDELISDLKQVLLSHKCNASLGVGIQQILAGIFLISLIVFFEAFR